MVEGNGQRPTTREQGDISDMMTVKFQLIDQALEQIRMMSVGGLFRDTPPGELLRYLLTELSKDVKVDESNRVQGVQMVEAHNPEPQKHLVLPHGLPFVELPDFIAKRCAAFYRAGLGVYLQNHVWYVYPLYDSSRFDNEVKTLTLINIPSLAMPATERTFRLTPNQVFALVTGEVRYRDPSEQRQLNQGNGVRFTDARNVMNGFSESQGGRTQVLRAANNHEYVSQERKSGLNNVHVSSTAITGNVFHELSKMAARSGAILECIWNSSDPSKIFPGMPARYIYEVQGQVYEGKGTVLQAHHFVAMHGQGFSSRRHDTHTRLVVHLEGTVDWEQDKT
jgi:hypothetical protein